MNRIFTASFLACPLLLLAPWPALAVTIETVPIGNPGNAGELSGTGAGGSGPNAIVGAVAYTYRIGTYEVTNAQYVEFLNAKAASDPLGLYNTSMTTHPFGGITRSGASGSFTYATVAGREDQPVGAVSWYDALRFTNWLHNNQGSGDTETGAYTLLGGAAEPTNADSITRNPGAIWFLPSEGEWYKAAYHQNDGITGNYFDYPTSSNTLPTLEPPPGGANSANAQAMGGGPNSAGAYTQSDSPYFTFDQGGNVREWNEALFGAGLRGVRGGTWSDFATELRASSRLFTLAASENIVTGFRVATVVPEPSSIALFAGGFVGLLVWARRKNRRGT